MRACGYTWFPPTMTPNSSVNGDRAFIEEPQVCVLEEGHDKWHRSASNHIAPNKKEN